MATDGDERFSVGVLIPLAEEYRAIAKVLAPKRSFERYDETFIVLETPGGTEVVAAVVRGMGQEAAAVVAERIARLGIDLLVVIGIAGSLSKDVRLGDVIAPNVIDLYGNAAKAVPDKRRGFRLRLSGDPYRMPWPLQSLLENLSVRPEHAAIWDEWQERGRRRQTQLKISPETHRDLTRPTPDLHGGHLASGAEVAASPEFGEWLKERDRAYRAIEMESGGVAVSAHRRNETLPVLVLRGISDFADERKAAMDQRSELWPEGAWRTLAAQNAADLMVTLIDHGLMPIAPVPVAPPATAPDAGLKDFVQRLQAHVELAEATTVVWPTTGQRLRQVSLLEARLAVLSRSAADLAPAFDAQAHGLGDAIVSFLKDLFPPFLQYARAEIEHGKALRDDDDFHRERKEAWYDFRVRWNQISALLKQSRPCAEALGEIGTAVPRWRLLGFDSESALREFQEPTMASLQDSPGEFGEHVLSRLLDGPVDLDELEAQGVPDEVRVGLMNRLLASSWAKLDGSHQVVLTADGRVLLERRLASWQHARS